MADWLLKMCHLLSFHCADRGKQTAHVLLRLVVNVFFVFLNHKTDSGEIRYCLEIFLSVGLCVPLCQSLLAVFVQGFCGVTAAF